MLRYLSAIIGLCLVLLFSITACDTPRGVWPNCRTVPGRPELNESGWYCEGIVPASNCACSKNATKRESLGPMCAVGEVGADIKFERAFPLQLAAAHRQANCEAWEAMASTARLVVLVDNHRALARRPAIGVSDPAAIPAEITEPFTGAAAELAGRLLRAREIERRARSYAAFVTMVENAADVEHQRLLARGA